MTSLLEARTLWEHVEKRAEATPDALMAQDDQGRTLTFAQYRDEAKRVAAGFAGLGLGEGDSVSWQLPTWNETLVLAGALSRLGVVQNPILPIYREREVGFCSRQTRAKYLIVPAESASFDFAQMAKQIASDTPGLEVLHVDRGNIPTGDPSALPAPPPAQEPADQPVRWRFYTSGTTADPKGAQHTDATVAASARGMALALQLSADDIHGFVFPFTHIGGIGWLFATLQSGCRQLVVESFASPDCIPFLSREGATLLGAGTVFHQAYLAAQRATPDTPLFPSARAFPGGAAPKPPQLHHDLKAEIGGVGIVSGYGLTEAPIVNMCTVDDPDDKLAHTEGRATPGVEHRIVTLAGAIAGAGEEGEIRVKGPQVMRGYLDSALDADAFDDEGFFRSGDLGYLDEGGWIVITGRLKDVIIRKGENISAKAVEDVLHSSPKVAEAAVIGLADPDTGERACAVVVTAEGQEELTFEEMTALCRDAGLMTQMTPEQLEHADALPRNPTGKVLKHQMKDEYASRPFSRQ